MRTLVVATLTVVVMALTGGCVGDGGQERSADRRGASDDSPPEETPSTPSPPSGDDPVVDSEACDKVRAGIDAFNAGEFDQTVMHFEEALPLAEEQDDGSVPASELIEAVRYYAELDPELYPEAARSSPKFAKYKATTLAQCVAGDDEAQEPPSAEA